MPQIDTPLNLEILDHLPQGIFITSRNGTVTFWNQCLEDWTGIVKAKIVGTPLEAHFPHLGTPKYTSRFEPLFEGGPPATFASQFHPQFLPCPLPNGHTRIQQTIAKAIWDKDTQEWQALFIIQDISDLHRQVVESQRLRKQAQTEVSERQKHQRLLEAIRQIESTFISTNNTAQTFNEVLSQLLGITESAYGFIGEVKDKDGKPYLKTHAITNIAWNEETQALYERHAPNMEFFNLKTLFGSVLTTQEIVISNEPQTDIRRGGLPEGHPALNAFLGIPIFHGGQFLGMAGVSNRTGGYDLKLVEYLQPLLASCGKILHAFQIEQQRHTVQIALSESEERLNTALHVTGGGAWDWNISTGAVVFSQSWYEYLGYDPEKLKAHIDSWKLLVHPEDLSKVMKALQDHFSGITPFYQCENRLLASDGTWKWNYDRGKVISWDEQGQPLRMVGTDMDISQIKDAELALRESQTRLDLAINGTQDGIWDWMDVNQDEEWWSPRFYELLGYKVGEISPSLSTFKALLHPQDIERITAAILNHFEHHHQFDIDYRLRTKNSGYRWFRAKGSALRDESGRPTRMAGSIQDITETREHQEERQRLSDRLILATASAGMGIWDWDIINNVLKWDKTMFDIYGVAQDQFSGAYDAWCKGVHPDDREHAEQELQLALEGKKDFNTEFRVVWADQSLRHVAARGIVERDENAKSVRMIGVNWDITLIKETDYALRESKEEFKTLINSGPILMWTCSLDGQCDFLNAQWVNYTGIPEYEQLGFKWLQQIHPDDHAQTKKDWQAAVETGSYFRTQFRIRNSQGDYRWFLTLANQIRDPNGNLLKWIGCNIDITTQLETEEDMAQLQRAVDQGIEGLALLDQEGKYTYINRAHADMYGYQAEELLGQTWKALYSKEQLAYIEETCLAELRNSGKWQGELVGLCKDGTSVPIEISLSLLTDRNGSPSGLVCICRNISERKESEAVITQTTEALEQQNQELASTRDKALAAARSKSEFLATMSHEIRTPLNGVIGMTDLLLGTGLDNDQREMVETVKNSGEFLLTIINDILDFSKIDAGKLDLEIIDFDVRAAIDEVLDILAERASQKHLELIGLVYASTPVQLQGDPGRIRQILFNLIGNAIKFTEEGEIVVDVSVRETLPEATTLRFAVTDTGMGISSEAQQGLFESFTQADSSTTRKFGGTGLGLAICKKLVTLMHGKIGVISEEGRGSTFWFTISFAHNSSFSPIPITDVALRGHRLCIVESNDTIRFLLQHYAQSWGMICTIARNGDEGFALLQQHATGDQSFDIAILDHTLSETIQEDGLSLAKRIRQDPTIAHLPLVLLTALGERGEGKLAQDAGFNGYLTKPIRHHQLQQCLQMILGHNQQAPSSVATPSSALITRHTVEEAQVQNEAHLLLAEDNIVNQKVAIRMIQKLGYRVDIVVNGQEAIEAIARTTYDLILMDCQMPEMDGLEATRKIRERESKKSEARSTEQDQNCPEAPDSSHLSPHCLRIPIIALTANALSGDRETCLEAGMDDFLAKPVGLEDLKTMLRKWLPQSKTNTSGDPPMAKEIETDSTDMVPCLDDTILANLKTLGGEEDPEFFLSVIDQFLSDLPRHLEGIQQAIKSQDAETLIKTAHACKGASRSIGAIVLAEISYTLESMGREGTMAHVPETFELWLREHERTTQALQQERDQPTAEMKSEK